MLLSKLPLTIVGSLITLAAATPTPLSTRDTYQCTIEDQQCCDTVTNPSNPDASALIGLLGLVVKSLDAIISLNCTPISVLGIGQTWCAFKILVSHHSLRRLTCDLAQQIQYAARASEAVRSRAR